MTDLREKIMSKASAIKDLAGRDIHILKEKDALAAADASNAALHDVYLQAMEMGVYPYRYVRNRDILSLEEQLSLARSRVAVIGAGGLGGQVILLLARLGVGHLVVIDRDVFDETNLNRQALCTTASLGTPKALQAAASVSRINPAVSVTARQLKLDSQNGREALSGCHVLVDALDTVPDRLALEALARSLGVPLVHGALAGFQGQVMTIWPEDPGLRQIYDPQLAPEDSVKRPEAVLGVPSITAALVATLEAMEVLKVLLGRGKPFRNRFAFVDLEGGELQQLLFEAEQGTGPPEPK
jgi:molybdopterin/thiamine biosynthesis adenylyltransferase